MKNNKRKSIKTQHVFLNRGQVFVKKDPQENCMNEGTIAEWFPTDFNWIPVQL